MLLNELNLKALNVSAQTILPVSNSVCVEGYGITFKITAFQSGYGSGKKTVISGSVKREDNGTEKVLENADIEKVRRVVASLCALTASGRTTDRKPRAPKERTKVEELKSTLAVARRVRASCCWVDINTGKLRTAFKAARQTDRENARKALQARAVDPLLSKIAKLSPEERALLLASLQ